VYVLASLVPYWSREISTGCLSVTHICSLTSSMVLIAMSNELYTQDQIRHNNTSATNSRMSRQVASTTSGVGLTQQHQWQASVQSRTIIAAILSEIKKTIPNICHYFSLEWNTFSFLSIVGECPIHRINHSNEKVVSCTRCQSLFGQR